MLMVPQLSEGRYLEHQTSLLMLKVQAAGGRTGIVAVVCGILMLMTLIFTPLVGLVPVEATAGVLAYILWLFIPKKKASVDSKKLLDWDQLFTTGVTVIMGIICFVTFSLDKAMLFGFVTYSTRQFFQSGRINIYLLLSTAILGLSIVLQYFFS